MIIRKFNIYLGESKFDGSASNPRIVWHRKQAVLIQLIDDLGNIGWGECWTFDLSADALIRFIQTEIKSMVLGAQIDSIEDFSQFLLSGSVLSGRHGMLSAAVSGVNCALWDMHSKTLGCPLYQTLNSSIKRPIIPVYASGGLYQKDDSPESLGAVVEGYVNQGFETVKMKFGGRSFDEDVARVSHVRKMVGPNVSIILDAVYSLDKDKASQWLPYWKNWNIQAIQAPFKAHDWEAMSWLNNHIPVMVFEAESRYEVFRALLQQNAIGILQFSPIAVGGINASLNMIELAKEFGKNVSLQCSSTWLAELISMHLAGACDNIEHVEYHQFHRMMFDFADPSYKKIQSGKIALLNNSGLGFEPPLELLINCNEALPDQ
ncbi:mandelate racemase/muconate lactonizing enzyme family protein [Marinomonas sp. 2405UD68-3]|uniref:mandelate racemase/muconate lactonizing enzyme family protein n=1 Tax=Marinomonas sp. 2405UD68-3 TaxID=3391835 RepID=UPI0039C96ECB